MAPLPEELVEQILLRFPSEDPASLVRAALVCWPWCRLVAGPGFRRRFRQFHCIPPVLGFLHNGKDFAGFVPISSFRPPLVYCGGWRAVDARHGRVLLHRWISASLFRNALFAIWDPITVELVELPLLEELYLVSTWQVAVLYGCARCDACDHLDCCNGNFQVAIVAAFDKRVHAHVYSPEAGVWHQINSYLCHPNARVDMKAASALVENALYFVLGRGTNLLMYNLVTQERSVIDLPPALFGQRIVLTATEDSRLGCIMVHGSKVYLWSREAGPEGDAGWTQSRFIKLEKLIPINPLSTSPSVVGYVDGTGVAFVHTGDGLLVIDLKSSQVKNVGKYSANSRIFPFTSFWTPEIGVDFTGEGQGVGAQVPEKNKVKLLGEGFLKNTMKEGYKWRFIITLQLPSVVNIN